MQMPKSKYEQTKVCDNPRIKELLSVQDVFSIESIDDSSVFELPGKKFSKLYALSDIHFAGVTDEEQKSIIINFSKVLKSIPCRFSYAVANEYVDERQFHEKILYPYHKNKYDDVVPSFHKVISDKIKDARQGLYQTIYVTLTVQAENMVIAGKLRETTTVLKMTEEMQKTLHENHERYLEEHCDLSELDYEQYRDEGPYSEELQRKFQNRCLVVTELDSAGYTRQQIKQLYKLIMKDIEVEKIMKIFPPSREMEKIKNLIKNL